MPPYYYMVSAVLLPLAFSELTQQSISVDLLFERLPRSLQIATMAFVLLVCTLCYGLLARISWFDAVHAFTSREIVGGMINVPIWPSRFLLPIAFALTTLVCLAHFFRILFSPVARDELLAVAKPSEHVGTN